jgi:PPOX class probable F420-dependent enzyme
VSPSQHAVGRWRACILGRTLGGPSPRTQPAENLGATLTAPVVVPDAYSDLVDEPVVATLGTMNDSGSIQLTGVWTQRDGTSFWVNTVRGHVKDRNMRARPDVSLIWYDPKNAYRFVSVTGHVVEIVDEDDPDRGTWVTQQIDDLCERYTGERPYASRQEGDVRVAFRIETTRVLVNG